jgi:6-phosphogluconolactonase
VYAYVGTYTDGGKPWRGGRGLGVHQFVVDSATGALKPIPGAPPAVASTGDNAKLRNPASLARHPKLPMLYAANEFEAGSVSAFRIGANGALSFVAEMACGGKDPAHLSVHPDGRFLFTANYASGDVSVIALRADGGFDADRAAVVYKDAAACGAAPCKPGADVVPAAARSHEGFATSDHDGPHAHMVHSDPGGNFVLVADLGLDRVISYRFDRSTGVLSQPSTVAVSEIAKSGRAATPAPARGMLVVLALVAVHRLRAHARRVGRPGRGAAGRPGHRRGHRQRAERVRAGQAAARAVRLLARSCCRATWASRSSCSAR